MPLQLISSPLSELCKGDSWLVADVNYLAQCIAYVSLGHARHVKKILEESGLSFSTALPFATDEAINLLTVIGPDPSHRDGWIFQVISWVAACKASGTCIVRMPQMRLADKGFDGILIRIDEPSGELSAVVICEDKATIKPRDIVRDKVWPEFRSMESGAKENVLMAELVALLDTVPTADADDAIKNLIWADIRHYRVSVTVEEDFIDNGRAAMFRGYEQVAPGAVHRREANVFPVADLRGWMQSVADLAIKYIKAADQKHV